MFGFEGLAVEAYDVARRVGHSNGDVEFFKGSLAGVRGPVLDAGVGNGRMLIPLIEAGYEVDGFDASIPMLARCEAHCRARGLSPRLERALFQNFDMGRSYAAIVVAGSGFMEIEDFDEGLATLKRFSEHLLPGGQLVIDLHQGFYRAVGHRAEERVILPNGDEVMIEDICAEIDGLAQLTVSHVTYRRIRNGQSVESDIQRFAQRAWGVGEFRLALEASGFKEVFASGNYRRGRPPRSDDAILTFEAVKA